MNCEPSLGSVQQELAELQSKYDFLYDHEQKLEKKMGEVIVENVDVQQELDNLEKKVREYVKHESWMNQQATKKSELEYEERCDALAEAWEELEQACTLANKDSKEEK